MTVDLSDEFAEWTGLLRDELAGILEPVGRDPGNYGFALAVPEDAGGACVMYAVGTEAKLVGEKQGSAVWLDRRYSPVEWVQNWTAVPQSTAALADIVRTFEARTASQSDDSELDQADDAFITDCATACLHAMLECHRAGRFGHVWYKVLSMSDGEHPVLVEAFETLNSGRALEEAAPLYAFG